MYIYAHTYIYVLVKYMRLMSSHASGICSPTPNCISMSRLIMPHIHQENMKIIIIHITSYASKIDRPKKKKKENSNCELMGNLIILILSLDVGIDIDTIKTLLSIP